MTETRADVLGAPPQASPPRRSTALVVTMVVLGVLLVAALIAAGVFFGGQRRDVHDTAVAAAAGSVVLDLPNATIVVTGGAGDDVTAALDGGFVVGEPYISAETSGDRTIVTGGCPTIPFTICWATVTVSVPRNVDLEIQGTNGAVTVTAVGGSIGIRTTNGEVVVADPGGTLRLGTTNGGIRVTGATSASTDASTTNGSIQLEYSEPVSDVTAGSTNGSVTVVVPSGTDYAVAMQTTNGDTELVGILNDPQAERRIIAHTTNGDVRVAEG